MAKSFKVLSTKRLEPSLIEQARENSIEIIEQEAIKTHPILTKEKQNEIFQVIQNKLEFAVFTSSNAVVAVNELLDYQLGPPETNWKIFSLSGKTKEALEENKFGTIVETADDAKELADHIIEKKVKEIVFFCGNKRRDELPTMLKDAGVQVQEVVVYETIETPMVNSISIDAILFFSPSAVQSFFSANQLNKDTVCFAIGQTTANSIKGFTSNQLLISTEPSQQAIVNKTINYFKKVVSQY
ncbi:MAG: hypothetical protein C4330_06515 [Chitinophagaceae bacterium]